MPSTIGKGLRGIRTMGGLVDRRRTRSPSGALMEMSALVNERQRLELEMDRILRRRDEIKERLAEIAAKEKRLYEFVKKPRRAAPAGPKAGEPPHRVRTVELNY